MQTHVTNTNASAATTAQTLTQSETLRIGERGRFTPKPGGVVESHCSKLGISLWVEKRKKEPTEFEKNLRTFIAIPMGYELVYGISYKGVDHVCGNAPRDLRGVVNGIAIASGVA